jgi:hypothetical protein
MKMIWESAIRADMVDGWTDEAVSELIDALNEAVEQTFCSIENQQIEGNPLVRLVLE